MDPLITNSIIYSIILGLSSMALTFTYLTTKVPNLAHGVILIVGTYTTFTISMVLKLNPYISLPISFLTGGLTSLFQYYLIIYPLSKRGANIVTQMIASLAFAIAFLGALNAYTDYINYAYLIQSRDISLAYLDPIINGTPMIFYVGIVIAIFLTIVLNVFLNRTRIGTAIRATVENSSLSEVLGINTSVVYVISWFLSGGIAGIAGSLYPLQFVFSPGTSFGILISIFASSILGGLGSIYGGLIGGIIEGLTEKYLVTQMANIISPAIGVDPYVINQYSGLIPLIIAALTLIFYPKGITGIKGE
jgi:branched-chain amino acid transport system permease protein